MIVLEKLLRYSIGKKTLVALTGLGLALFLVAHMSGNMLMFFGPDDMNSYAEGLRQIMKVGGFPLGLWIARLGLLAMFAVHVVLAAQLTMQNRAARPVKYQYNNTVNASLASRTMILSGLLLLAFVIYHLLHFTLGVTNPQHFQVKDHLLRHDAYTMYVLGFREPVIFVTYLISMMLLAAHLYHGISSLFQTMGWVKTSGYGLLQKVAIAFVLIVVGGFLSPPVAVLLKVIKLPGE